MNRQVTSLSLHSDLVELVGCAADLLDPYPGRVVVSPAELAPWDDCCEGQVWASTVRVIAGWPDQQNTPLPCVGPWRADIRLGVVRCAAVVNDHGQPPTVTAVTHDAKQQAADRDALWCAWSECWGVGDRSIVAVEWTPLGPEGGCVGGMWDLGVMMLPCPCS